MLAALREDEINYEDVTRALDEKEAAADELSQAVFSKHPVLIADLFPRRRLAIEAACDTCMRPKSTLGLVSNLSTVKNHQAEREDALSRFLRNAHVQVETARSNEKVWSGSLVYVHNSLTVSSLQQMHRTSSGITRVCFWDELT